MGYDAITSIKEKALLTTRYEVSMKGGFSGVLEKEHPLIKQAGKYGTEEIKETMRRLGLLKTGALAGTT